MTLLEASELVKAIEETFGVDASAAAAGPAMMMAAPGAAPAEAAEALLEQIRRRHVWRVKIHFSVESKDDFADGRNAVLRTLSYGYGCE